MAFLRSILWVPMIFGIMLGGMVIANVYANGFSVEFVAFPDTVINAYRASADWIMAHTLEIFLPIEISPFWRDFIALSVAGYASLFRVAIVNWSAFRAIIAEAFSTAKPGTNSGFFDWIIAIISVLICFIQPLIFAAFIMLPIFDWIKRRVLGNEGFGNVSAFFLAGAVALLNFLAAVGLLWWNAAEIERLTAGIG